eukprot:scaffold120307_cov31-Tisochrysis_lutea.AAC.3
MALYLPHFRGCGAALSELWLWCCDSNRCSNVCGCGRGQQGEEGEEGKRYPRVTDNPGRRILRKIERILARGRAIVPGHSDIRRTALAPPPPRVGPRPPGEMGGKAINPTKGPFNERTANSKHKRLTRPTKWEEKLQIPEDTWAHLPRLYTSSMVTAHDMHLHFKHV